MKLNSGVSAEGDCANSVNSGVSPDGDNAGESVTLSELMPILLTYYETVQASSFPHIKFLCITSGGSRNLTFPLHQTDCEKLPENLALVTSFKSALPIEIN